MLLGNAITNANRSSDCSLEFRPDSREPAPSSPPHFCRAGRPTDRLSHSLSSGIHLVNSVDGSAGIRPVDIMCSQGFSHHRRHRPPYYTGPSMESEGERRKKKRNRPISSQAHTSPAVLSDQTAWLESIWPQAKNGGKRNGGAGRPLPEDQQVRPLLSMSELPSPSHRCCTFHFGPCCSTASSAPTLAPLAWPSLFFLCKLYVIFFHIKSTCSCV